MLATNSDLERLAASAAAFAWRSSSSACLRSVMSDSMAMKFVSRPSWSRIGCASMESQ
jgi:hypothetical protein